jgi:hypothetical protein
MSVSFNLEVSRRLPLADAAFRLLDYLSDDTFLDGVFARHHGRSYEEDIRFPLFVHLVTEAVLGHRGSPHQTFRQAQDENRLESTVQALYGKLRRVPLSLSLGLFTEASARLLQLGSAATTDPLPQSLAGFRVLGFDGKKIKYVTKKLKPLRGLKGNIFGGKLLVVEDLRTRHAVGASAAADGEAGDNPLVPEAVAQVRAVPSDQPRLWVGDRGFCEYETLKLLSAGTDQFVVRYGARFGFHPDPDVPERTGTDELGRPFTEQWGYLGAPSSRRRVYVRKITVTRVDQSPLAVVTSLLDVEKYPAGALLSVYGSRWGLEVMFQQVVQTFNLRHLIGSTAEGTVFQAMLCLLMYNITLVIRDGVAAGTQRTPDAVSLQVLFGDLVRDLTGWVEVLEPEETVELMRVTRIEGAVALWAYLRTILGAVWTDRWIKAPTRKRPPKKPPRAYLCGGHSSVDKIRRGVHHEIPLNTNKKKRKNKKDPPPYEAKKRV